MYSDKLEDKSTRCQMLMFLIGLSSLFVVIAVILGLLSLGPVGAAVTLSGSWMVAQGITQLREYQAAGQKFGFFLSYIPLAAVGLPLVSSDAIVDLLLEPEMTLFEGSSVALSIIGISRIDGLPNLYAGLILLAIQLAYVQIVYTVVKQYWDVFGSLVGILGDKL